MIFIRSLIFNILFYLGTAIIAIITCPCLLIGPKTTFSVIHFWHAYIYWLERHILDLDYIVEGQENIPDSDTPYIVVMKHQSAWETMKLVPLFGRPMIVMKKELMSYPIWARFARYFGAIPVDRSERGKIIPKLLQAAEVILQQKRPMVIFPQGTRVHPNTTVKEKKYKYGFMKLYQHLDVPLVPVSINAGLYWPRNSFMKKPGRIQVTVHPPIPPKQPAENVYQDVVTTIETESTHLAE